MRFRPMCALLSVPMLGLLACACGSVYRVRGADERPLEGVPFFPRVGVCRHETSYLEPVYRVAVELVSGTREITLFETLLRGSALQSPELSAVRNAVAGDGDLASINTAFTALMAASEYRYNPQAAPSGLFLASNSATLESQADYSRPLYVNVSRPWIGSASANTRLAPDGTLSEASAEVKDTTADTLLSVLPAKEVLTKMITEERSRALGAIATPALMRLALEPQFVRHTYTSIERGPCPSEAHAIEPGAPGAMYRREQLRAVAQKAP